MENTGEFLAGFENRQAHFIPNTGIPAEMFEITKQWKEMHGKSGRMLQCAAAKEGILLRDKEFPDIRVQAMMMEPNEVYTVVDTKFRDEERTRHPDFNAKILLPIVVKFLEDQGNRITAFRSHWVSTGMRSTNYFQFKEALIESGIPIDGLSEISKDDPRWKLVSDAALSTWSGRMVQGMGFNQVDKIEYFGDKGDLEIVYKRNS